jgi:hypothetical protein
MLAGRLRLDDKAFAITVSGTSQILAAPLAPAICADRQHDGRMIEIQAAIVPAASTSSPC